MNKYVYLTGNEPGLRSIVNAVYPEYKGKKIKFIPTTKVHISDTYWGGGTRSTWRAVNLSTKVSKPFPNIPPPQFGGPSSVLEMTLFPGMAVVEHSIFCGEDMGLTFYIHPEDAPFLLPAPTKLSPEERIVCEYSIARKSSYVGKDRCDMAMDDGKIPSRQEWDKAKESCITKKLLNKAGAITPAGRNAFLC